VGLARSTSSPTVRREDWGEKDKEEEARDRLAREREDGTRRQSVAST
jgi:hypothetical protein